MTSKSLKIERLPLLDISEIWGCACGGVGEFVDGDSLPRPDENCFGVIDQLACGTCGVALFSINARTVNTARPDADWTHRYFYDNGGVWTVPTTVYRVTQDGGWQGVPRSWVVGETLTPEGMLHVHHFPAAPVRSLHNVVVRTDCLPLGWHDAEEAIADAWPVALALLNISLATVEPADAEFLPREAP